MNPADITDRSLGIEDNSELLLRDKQSIIFYAVKNPNATLREIALHFSDILGRRIDHTIVHKIIKEKVDGKSDLYTQQYPRILENHLRESFLKDLYEKWSHRQSLTKENMASDKNLRPLALELAADPKYKEYFTANKFCSDWMTRFRKKYNLERSSLTAEEKSEICDYKRENPTTALREMASIFTSRFDKRVGRNMIARVLKDSQLMRTDEEIELIRETFSQDLFEEVSRRQSLTAEYLTIENVRAIGKELAVDPKYQGVLSNHKFSYQWISDFRKKFNIIYKNKQTGVIYNKRFTLDEKLQIIQFIDSNPGLTNVEVGRHFSTILGRKVYPDVVRKVKLNREKYLKNDENQDFLAIEIKTEDQN